MSIETRPFTLGRVRRASSTAGSEHEASRKSALALVRKGHLLLKESSPLSFSRVSRGPYIPRNIRELSLARVRRDENVERVTRRPFSLARVRRIPKMIRRVRQLTLARV